MIKRILTFIAGMALLLFVAVILNTLFRSSKQVNAVPTSRISIDENMVAEHLAKAVSFQTISSVVDAKLNADQFRGLHDHLRVSYPRVHAMLKQERVGELSLLYTWTGSDPSALPILLMAHQDVVPIALDTEVDWSHPPFSGIVRDGFVWGRGAWDNKANLVAQLEAVEALLTVGFRPRSTVYFAFGADEEVGGFRGAAQIADLLATRGVRLDFVMDEGLLITEGVMPGLDKPLALIGVAEKGFVSVDLSASSPPGHSSMPPPRGSSVIARMSAALKELDDSPLPAEIRGVAHEMFDTIAPELHGLNRVLLSNLWLFEPIVRWQLQAQPSANAMLRSTTALTIMHAGNKDNVLPGRAEATVNFRILQGDSRALVLQHVSEGVRNFDVHFSERAGGSEPSTVSPTQSRAYLLIARTIRELFPGTIVAPGLMIGGTDSRHFLSISDNVFRFSPVRAKPQDLPRFHGTNERISVANLTELVGFYHRLLQQTSAADPVQNR